MTAADTEFEIRRGTSLMQQRIERLVAAHPDATEELILEMILAEDVAPIEQKAMVMRALTEAFEELFEAEVAAGRAVKNPDGTYTQIESRPADLPLPPLLRAMEPKEQSPCPSWCQEHDPVEEVPTFHKGPWTAAPGITPDHPVYLTQDEPTADNPPMVVLNDATLNPLDSIRLGKMLIVLGVEAIAENHPTLCGISELRLDDDVEALLAGDQ